MISTPDQRTFHRFGDRLTAVGIHFNLTDALRHHLVLKAGRLLRHGPRIESIHVEVRHDPHASSPARAFVVTGRVTSPGHAIQRTAAAANAYTAVDRVTARLDTALRRRAQSAESRPRSRTATPWPARTTLSPAP